MVRFFYKADVQQKAKILRKVRFRSQQYVAVSCHPSPTLAEIHKASLPTPCKVHHSGLKAAPR